jgi:hypothetical protein
MASNWSGSGYNHDAHGRDSDAVVGGRGAEVAWGLVCWC